MEEGGAQAKALVGEAARLWSRLAPAMRPSSTPGSCLLLLCFLTLGLRTNKLLPCPPIRVRGQEAPMVA